MIRFIVFPIMFLLLGSTFTNATPYYPNGIPDIGPLKEKLLFGVVRVKMKNILMEPAIVQSMR